VLLYLEKCFEKEELTSFPQQRPLQLSRDSQVGGNVNDSEISLIEEM
jgi:hypothetical protein